MQVARQMISQDNSTGQGGHIPHILHYIYLSGFDAFLGECEKPRAKMKKWQYDSCVEVHPHWEVKFWTQEMAEELLKEHYSWFLPVWGRYTREVINFPFNPKSYSRHAQSYWRPMHYVGANSCTPAGMQLESIFAPYALCFAAPSLPLVIPCIQRLAPFLYSRPLLQHRSLICPRAEGYAPAIIPFFITLEVCTLQR